MGFVEYHRLILRQELRTSLPIAQSAKSREKQGMVDHHDFRFLQVFAGFEVKAVVVVAALLAQAVARVALDKVPNRAKRTESKVASATIPRRTGPIADRFELVQRQSL